MVYFLVGLVLLGVCVVLWLFLDLCELDVESVGGVGGVVVGVLVVWGVFMFFVKDSLIFGFGCVFVVLMIFFLKW